METPQLSDNGKKLNAFLDEKMYEGFYTNNDLIQFIESAGRYLNLKTISDYANQNKMSYNGVKKFRKTHTIFNVKFVIDNE